MMCDTLGLGRAYELVRTYFLATGVLSDSHWQIRTRWLCLFYPKSMVDPPRSRFCCLQYHIMLYVRSCCTTACCGGVALLILHTAPYEMLRLLLPAPLPVSLGSTCSCYYCCSCTNLHNCCCSCACSWSCRLFLLTYSELNPDLRKIHFCGT